MDKWVIYGVKDGPLRGKRLRKIGEVEAPNELDAVRLALELWPDEMGIAARPSGWDKKQKPAL